MFYGWLSISKYFIVFVLHTLILSEHYSDIGKIKRPQEKPFKLFKGDLEKPFFKFKTDGPEITLIVFFWFKVIVR